MSLPSIGRDPRLWPHVWALPVMRKGGDPVCEPKDAGVVVHERGVVLPRVYVVNLFGPCGKIDLDAADRVDYPDLDALFHEWEVD